MDRRNQQGSVAAYVAIFLLALALLGALVFAVWAYRGRQDYKNNSDQKVAQAVSLAQSQQKTNDDLANAEANKQPFKTYKGPATYGTVSFNYPKTWSGYVDLTGSSEPINGYFYPDVVPGVQSATAFALRVELVNSDYSSVVKQHDSQIKSGSAKASAYVPPKMVGVGNVQPGTRIDGSLDQQNVGSMVIIKVRDKTLEIYSQSNDFLNDFNNTILSSLTFAP